jgi:DNA-binding winged helix-turn-helix (wHTH) protein/TolB-like protein/Tfp pilus assembly protein PilF
MARVFYQFGPFRLDPAGRRLLRDGAAVVLTSKVFDTLLVLVEQHGQSLTRSELIARIWPETSAGEHNLNQSIALLRKVLDDNSRQPDYIATLPGRGYSFIAEVITDARSSETEDPPLVRPTNGNGSGLSTPPVVPPVERVSSLPAITPPSAGARMPWRYAVIGVAVMALAATLIAASPLGSRVRTIARAMASSLLSPALPRSVSVLPFENLGISPDEPDKQYIATGLTQELTAELARLSGLKVIVGRLSSALSSGSASSDAFDPKSAGRSLNVESLLKGSVRRSGEQYRIAVQLIDSRDGSELWSGVYTADVSDIPSVEEQIVRHTADALRIPWSASIDEQWARRHVENPEAHDLYLQARYLWNMRTTDALERSIPLFQQAIAKDSNYARAYAGLADSYAVMAANLQMPVATAVPLARDAAAKALRLDPTLAEPHATLGLLKSKFEWDFDGAQEEFRRSLALNPGYATAHHWAGLNLTAMGQFEAADAELRKAQELDPLSRMISEGLFENYYAWHRFDYAIQTIRAFQSRNPAEYAGLFSSSIGDAYLAKGMYPEAEASYRQMAECNDNCWFHLALVQAREGHSAEARSILDRLERTPDGSAGPTLPARVYVALGEPDAAIALLQRAWQVRDPDFVNMKYDPALEPLANDARFQQLEQSMTRQHEQAEATNH